MLKRIVISLSAVMFLLGAGTSFAAKINSLYLINGETSKAKVLSLFGEPEHITKDQSNREKFVYERDGARLEVTFDKDVVWHSRDDSDGS
jgi:hypothetical protein